MNKLSLVILVVFAAFTLPGCRNKQGEKSCTTCCSAEPVVEVERESGPMQADAGLEEEDLK